MCPLVLELKNHSEIECVVCLAGQHREMLEQVMEAFHVEADYNLDIMRQRQSLTTITTSILEKMEPLLREEKPDLVLVHGDTTTACAAAQAAFYQQTPWAMWRPDCAPVTSTLPFRVPANKLTPVNAPDECRIPKD